MLFFLSTPEYNKIQYNVTKIKVHLRSGVVEILENHQDLIGKISNNLLEIESMTDNKIEKSLFVVQHAVFVVSNKPLEKNPENSKGIAVYVYSSRVREINSSLPIDEIIKLYDQKRTEYEFQLEKEEKNKVLQTGQKTSEILKSLKENVGFFEKIIEVVKNPRLKEI